mmetsp:Transcript_33256/g.49557  ORF Transcript_33256/g.49557 Transcript_33256/m.49557 type:complete len:93 (-) Transcript_33256:958-1236(-)
MAPSTTIATKKDAHVRYQRHWQIPSFLFSLILVKKGKFVFETAMPDAVNSQEIDNFFRLLHQKKEMRIDETHQLQLVTTEYRHKLLASVKMF